MTIQVQNHYWTTCNKHNYGNCYSNRSCDGDLWDGPKVAAWMSQTLEQPIYPQRGWEYLRALEMRRRRPRPEHEEANPHEQQQWKKNGANRRASAVFIS